MSLFDFLTKQIFTTARIHLDAVTLGNVGQLISQVDFLLLAHFSDCDTCIAAQLLEVALYLAILVDKAEIASLHQTFQLGGKVAKGSQEVIVVAR